MVSWLRRILCPAFGNFLHQRAERRVRITLNSVRRVQHFDQIAYLDRVLCPADDLLKPVFRFEPLYLRADDLRQSGGNLLRDVALIDGKIQPDEGDLKLPIRRLWPAAPHDDDPAESHQENHRAKK